MRERLILALLVALLALPVRTAAQTAPADNTAAADSTAAAEADSVAEGTYVVSLLTCSPGQEVYELYGHTALRVVNEQRGLDVVFNYGVFSFEQPHFVWRFVLGECDYMVLGYHISFFLDEYARRGSSVTEQVLNLYPAEAEALAGALIDNCRPENRVYRYNIFRSNCTTRARDMVEAHIYGQVRYPARPRRNTFRSILHEFTREHLWAREGNDLLLGADVDTLLTERDEMFSPIYLMHYADSAVIDAGPLGMRPLVSETRELLPADPARQAAAKAALPQVPFSPAAAGWVLLALGVVLAAWEWWRKRIVWAVDAVLMTLQGLAGVELTFMALFSQHPGVATNWQTWVLNPLPLLFVVSVVRADIRRQTHIYHRLAAVWLLAFVPVYCAVPQHFSTLIMPLALLLLTRAVAHILIYRHQP